MSCLVRRKKDSLKLQRGAKASPTKATFQNGKGERKEVREEREKERKERGDGVET